jgi:hypothetical protein
MNSELQIPIVCTLNLRITSKTNLGAVWDTEKATIPAGITLYSH